MESLKIIESLSNANGAPGFETDVVKVASSLVNSHYDREVDAMNNCFFTSPDVNLEKPLIMVDGHTDEVALMVQSISAKGLLNVIALGGWDIKNLLSQKLRLITENGTVIKGIVSSVPVHFLSPEKRNSVPDIKDITVDVGASSKEEVLAMGITIGMPLIPDAVFEYQAANDVMIGKAFDNRMGCSLVVDTLNACKEKNYHQVLGVLSTQEEVGLRGAQVVGNSMIADMVIVFEGTPADDTFTAPDEAQGVLGKGVQIRLADSSMVAHPKLTRLAEKIAKDNGINYQMAVRRGGGTNAGAYHRSDIGIPCVVLGVPVRYIHAHYGIAKLEDYKAAQALAMALIDHIEENGIML